MTPKRHNQKMKRSTAKPRSGVRRTARRAGVALPPPEPIVEQHAPASLASEPRAETPAPAAPKPRRSRNVIQPPTEPVKPEPARRWSITYPSRQALFKDKPSERRPADLEEFHPAALEQFEEARQVAMRILDSGVVGEGECVTTISGHANDEHQPKNGQPNDRLAISIQQLER